MQNPFFIDDKPRFDFKVLFIKILTHWKWFVFSLIISLTIAHYINLRKQNTYQLNSFVTVKEETNPFFTSNMSLVFNWGGISDKLNLIITTFKSRTHNEKVVEKLKSYIEYKKKGKYYFIDIYKDSPVVFEMNKIQPQVINLPLKIKILDQQYFNLSINPPNKEVELYDFINNKTVSFNLKSFEKKYKFGEKINLPFLSGTITLKPHYNFDAQTEYFIEIKNFNDIVSKYINDLKVETKDKNSSILILKLKGNNKKQIEDYLNTTSQLLQKQILDDKNKFANNTINFIDSLIFYIQKDLNIATQSLTQYVSKRTLLSLDDATSRLYEKITALDLQKNTLLQNKIYYEQLLKYLQNKKNYEDIPAPTVAGINDPTIIEKVGKITQLSILKKKELVNFKEDAATIKQLDLEIESLRQSLLETVQSSIDNINQELNLINHNISKVESQINKLPTEKQTLLNLKRQYEIKQEVYNRLIDKRNEASIVKASNVSDLKIIDPAKDIGQLPIAPNRKVNYIIAIVLGLFLPAGIIFILFMLDNKVHDISEVEELADTPILGQIFHYDKKEKLPVINNPQDTVAESFRSLRSALRFKLPRNKNSHTVLFTSSISGEGKTFISVNLSLILALSNKKTVLLEFDFRKPKFKNYFKEALHSQKGLTDYLNENASINEIIIPTKTENLDLILSGKKAPNPSELILREKTTELFKELREKYDIIIIDTPPLGIVSDAMELQKNADITLFVIRENYSLKTFVKDIDEKYHKKTIENLAIVYNDFKIDTFKKYGYGKNYGYLYKYGYGEYYDHKKIGFFKRILRKFLKK